MFMQRTTNKTVSIETIYLLFARKVIESIA